MSLKLPDPVIIDPNDRANPDCDFKEPQQKRGCPRQSEFVFWLKGKLDPATGEHAYEKHKFFACRSHTPNIWSQVILMAQVTSEVEKYQIKPCVADIRLLKEKLLHIARKGSVRIIRLKP